MTPVDRPLCFAGFYVFNTEAHPIDGAAVHCCSAERVADQLELQAIHDNIDLVQLFDLFHQNDNNNFEKMWQDLVASDVMLDNDDVMYEDVEEGEEEEVSNTDELSDDSSLDVSRDSPKPLKSPDDVTKQSETSEKPESESRVSSHSSAKIEGILEFTKQLLESVENLKKFGGKPIPTATVMPKQDAAVKPSDTAATRDEMQEPISDVRKRSNLVVDDVFTCPARDLRQRLSVWGEFLTNV